MIFELHPPEAAGPLLIGATGHDTVDVLRQPGDPQVLCKTPGSRSAPGPAAARGFSRATPGPLTGLPERRPPPGHRPSGDSAQSAISARGPGCV